MYDVRSRLTFAEEASSDGSLRVFSAGEDVAASFWGLLGNERSRGIAAARTAADLGRDQVCTSEVGWFSYNCRSNVNNTPLYIKERKENCIIQ